MCNVLITICLRLYLSILEMYMNVIGYVMCKFGSFRQVNTPTRKRDGVTMLVGKTTTMLLYGLGKNKLKFTICFVIYYYNNVFESKF